jgi:hypothetical protein
MLGNPMKTYVLRLAMRGATDDQGLKKRLKAMRDLIAIMNRLSSHAPPGEK